MLISSSTPTSSARMTKSRIDSFFMMFSSVRVLFKIPYEILFPETMIPVFGSEDADTAIIAQSPPDENLIV